VACASDSTAEMSVAITIVFYMIIDCDSCVMRGPACEECVVTFMTIPVRQPDTAELDAAEARAIEVLAEAGLIPPLRMERKAG